MPEWMRNWAKPAIVGVAMGAAVTILIVFARGTVVIEALTPWLVEKTLGDPLQLISHLRSAGSPEWIIRAIGSSVPIAAGIAFTIIVIPVLRWNINGTQIVEYMWPSPPDILNVQFERLGTDYIYPYPNCGPFIGRETEIQTLMRFSGSASGKDSMALALTGVEGIGKTRLALAWLSRLRALGWDVGILKQGVQPLGIRRARFRRRTAIVIDEPSSSTPNWYELLDALQEKDGPLRILIADRAILPRPPGPKQGEIIPQLNLEPLSDELLLQLTPGLAPDALAAAEGRPLYALLGCNPATTIAARAHRRLMEAKVLGGEEAQRLLALAALAGPIAHESLRSSRADLSLLRRLFEGASRDLVARILPALKPTLFANSVLLQYCEERTSTALWDLVDEALKANPSAVEFRLGMLWTDPCLTAAQAEVRSQIQAQFDKTAPRRVESIQLLVKHYMNQIQLKSDEIGADVPIEDRILNVMEGIYTIFRMRPFDRIIQQIGLNAAISAVAIYGNVGRWDDLERWGKLLFDMGAEDSFHSNPTSRLCGVMAAANVVRFYGKAERWDDLERWGQFLLGTNAADPFRTDISLRIYEAKGAAQAVTFYGKSHHWDDLERWGQVISRITADKSCFSEPTIRSCEAEAAAQSILVYGQAGRWSDLERWGQRIHRIDTTGSLRVEQAKAAYHAALVYGEAGRWDDLERWARLLSEITTTPPFGSNANIRYHEVRAAVNAINVYGKAGRWSDLRRWDQRLTSIVKAKPVSSDPVIRQHEAMAMANAAIIFSEAARWKDLEYWGRRLTDIVSTDPFGFDPIIRTHEARAVPSVISAYGKARLWGNLEFWGQRITGIGSVESLQTQLEIRLYEVMAVRNAMFFYGAVNLWDDLERWGKHLSNIATSEFLCTDPNIRLVEIVAAGNAVIAYGKAGLQHTAFNAQWRRKIATVSREFPYNAKIQHVANNFGLNAASQNILHKL